MICINPNSINLSLLNKLIYDLDHNIFEHYSQAFINIIEEYGWRGIEGDFGEDGRYIFIENLSNIERGRLYLELLKIKGRKLK